MGYLHRRGLRGGDRRDDEQEWGERMGKEG